MSQILNFSCRFEDVLPFNDFFTKVFYVQIYMHYFSTKVSRGAGAQSVTVKLTGYGFNRPTRGNRIFICIYIFSFLCSGAEAIYSIFLYLYNK